MAWLCVNPPQPRVVSHSIYRKHISRQTRVDPILIRKPDYVIKAAHHYFVQTRVDRFFVPEEAHSVLHPLEVAYGDTARVRQYVWNHEDTLGRYDLVGIRGLRTMCTIRQNSAPDSIGVMGVDLVFGRCRHQDLAFEL